MIQKFDLKYIGAKLKGHKIFFDPATLRKNPVQGAGSKVFVVDSNNGKLMIHKQLQPYRLEKMKLF
jgi:hypothetical protein